VRASIRTPHGNRFCLVLGEHQRRQLEAAPQYIANPGRALDRDAPRLQRGDIAIDRPHRDFQFVGERSGDNRTRRRAQKPQDVKQTIGAAQGHGIPS
jgi:hypothetical protein